jgi:hypothetical protein
MQQPTAQTMSEQLARFGAIDWDLRAAMFKKPSQDDAAWKVRLEVESTLATTPSALPLLLARLTDTNRHLRALVASVLGVRAEKSAMAPLSSLLLSEKDPTTRLYAVEALGRIGGKEAEETLTTTKSSETNPNVRYAIDQAQLRLKLPTTKENALLTAARAFDFKKLATATLGKPAPDFTLESDTGMPIQLAPFRGKNSVILLFQLADW